MNLDEKAKDTAQDALYDNDPETQKKLGKIAAILSIAVIVVGGLFWLFTMNATANSADKKADDNAAAIAKKADKQDVHDGFEQINKRLDKLSDYLMGSPTSPSSPGSQRNRRDR